MTRPIKFTDMAVFQPSSYSYIKSLKDDGAGFNFVKLTEDPSLSYPHRYINPKASAQINNSLKVFGSVGLYHFWHTCYGNSASFFINTAKSYGIDFATTKVALDVEAGDLPYYCTKDINAFESELVNAGFKPGNIWTYVSKSWIDAGRVNTRALKYGFVWCAYYPYNSVYADNSIKPFSGVLPKYNAVQFSGLGSQDWSYDYTGTLTEKSKPVHKSKKPIRKPVAKKPVNHYLKGGSLFEVVSSQINGYRDPQFDIKNGVLLKQGSRIHGQVLRFNGYTRLDTPIGWFSTNTKYLKAVK